MERAALFAFGRALVLNFLSLYDEIFKRLKKRTEDGPEVERLDLWRSPYMSFLQVFCVLKVITYLITLYKFLPFLNPSQFAKSACHIQIQI